MTHQRGELRWRSGRPNRPEPGVKRRETTSLDTLHIHGRSKEGARFSLDALWRQPRVGGDLGEHHVQPAWSQTAQVRPIGREGQGGVEFGAIEPGAVLRPVEVVTRLDRGIAVGEVDAPGANHVRRQVRRRLLRNG